MRLGWVLVALMLWAGTAGAAQYRVLVLASYPHDRNAFTQGLLYAHGVLYESIGLYGKSALRRVDLDTGKVLAEQPLDKRYFAEGLALVGDRLIQLTWKSGTGFIYDRTSLKPLGQFHYRGQGWGLAYDGKRLVMSDGSDTLRFLDAKTYAPSGELKVTYQGQPISQLNELEIIEGQIWANVWQTDLIVRIDPQSGHVVGVIRAPNLRQSLTGPYKIDVLNGIAYDASTKRILVTGKRWPKLFSIKLEALTDNR